MRTLLSGLKLTLCRSWMFLMFTSRRGVVISSFISESRSVPPARISTSPQLFPSRAGTCSLVLGLVNSNGCIAASLIEGCQHPVRRDWQEGNTRSNGIGYGIGNSGSGRNRRRLAQAYRAAFVVSFAGHHVHYQFTNVAYTGQPVEIHGGIQHAPGVVVHDPFFIERGSDAHNHCAVTLAFRSLHADNESAILHADHLVHLHDTGFGIYGDIGHHCPANTAVNQ